MGEPLYRRAVVKLSGEALLGDPGTSIEFAVLERLATDLVCAASLGSSLAIVVGGGNLVRGAEIARAGIPRATGDAMGMLATVINALALQAAVERAGGVARTLSAIAMPQVCEIYSRERALRYLAQQQLVILAAGTGNPFFTTDTAAVLRASELGAEAVLKATDVDGVYSADPRQDGSARRFDRLTHEEAIRRELKIMDATAFTLARENHIPIIVFSIRDPGAVVNVLVGKGRATLVE